MNLNQKIKLLNIHKLDKPVQLEPNGKLFDYYKDYPDQRMYYSVKYLNDTSLDELLERDDFNKELFSV
ncbi:hydrolase [Jeotgalibacillus salarius]|uniref:Hydrolase n=1 Tax=Jeotgalibacillus salarius TaxID=546023 RepID=A0A4Y8LPK6_9BACL|nr:hydrolase [Jeotgalibacillus salarius]TFE02877.1 hydrolase [Jeotgalibacillus salarius]